MMLRSVLLGQWSGIETMPSPEVCNIHKHQVGQHVPEEVDHAVEQCATTTGRRRPLLAVTSTTPE